MEAILLPSVTADATGSTREPQVPAHPAPVLSTADVAECTCPDFWQPVCKL